jgi:hypothetical protein
METLIETVDYKDHSIEIHNDLNPESPREWDNLGTILYGHRRLIAGDYSFGERKDNLPFFSEPSDFQSWAETHNVIYLPVYMLDHGIIQISTTTTFKEYHMGMDSGQLGVIFVTREKVRKEYSWKKITQKRKEKIEEYLRNEISTYDKYLSGSCVGYTIKDSDGNDLDEGSCWGFYDQDECIKEAKSIVDYHTNKYPTLFDYMREQEVA